MSSVEVNVEDNPSLSALCVRYTSLIPTAAILPAAPLRLLWWSIPGDPLPDHRPARRYRRTRLRMRTPGDATPPIWRVLVPGVWLGGSYYLATMTWQTPTTTVGPTYRVAAH